MAEAKCLNDGCEKDTWVLRKRPEEYNRGPTCPDCGTTRVEVDRQRAQQGAQEADTAAPSQQTPQQASQAPQPAQQPQQAQAQPPAPQQAQQGAQPPATPDNSEAIQQGLQLGQNVQALAQGSRFEKLQAGGAAVVSLAQYLQEQDQAAQDRARNTDEVRAVDEYPRCPECDGALKRLPPAGSEFDCPHCTEPLIV